MFRMVVDGRSSVNIPCCFLCSKSWIGTIVAYFAQNMLFVNARTVLLISYMHTYILYIFIFFYLLCIYIYIYIYYIIYIYIIYLYLHIYIYILF